MKFDLFYQLPCADSQDAARRYRELIDEAVEADRLGFNTIWLAEVHFAPHFSIMPAPMMLLSAIAERTTRLRLGMAVNLVPLHHPVRLAEEAAMLDVLSNGRLEFGAGRGAFPLNYRGYGVDIDTSRELFVEGLDFVRQAWTQPKLNFTGKHFNVSNVAVIPHPLQKPLPPMRLAANSPDTFSFAGEQGYPIFAGGPVNPIPVLGERLEIYKRAAQQAGRPAPEDWLAAALMVFVGRDRAAVRKTIEPSLLNYFRSVGEIIEPHMLGPAVARADFDRFRERLLRTDYGVVDSTMGIFGEPAYCINRITELRERFNFTRLVNWFEVGGLSGHREVMDSMRLFAEKVMPRLAAA